MISRKFPNLTDFLEQATSSFNGGFVSENSNKMSFMMPVYTFGHHVGDNWLMLEKAYQGYSFSIESRVGSRVKVKTNSKSTFTEDLAFEKWNEIVDEILLRHAAKPEFLAFSSGKVGRKFDRQVTGRNSGCMVTIAFLLIISVPLYFILT